MIRKEIYENFFLLIFVLASLISYGCSANIEKSKYESIGIVLNEDSNFVVDKIFNVREISSEQNSLNKSALDQSEMKPGILSLDVWQFHHYIPAENKFIGIWPTHNRYEKIEKLKQLKEKWGFEKIFIQAHWLINVIDRFYEAGFNDENIIVDLNVGFPKVIKDWPERFKNVYAFYVDEPYSVKPNYTVDEFSDVYKKIKSLKQPLFITGDFKPSSCLDEYVQYTDKVLFTSYHRTYQLFGCTFIHWPENIDQRDSWDIMKERYGEKFTSTWIAGHQDTSEYYQLFKKAKDLNLESIWYYQLQDSSDDISDNNLAEFCDAAWQNGYLRKINQKVKFEFKCKKNDIPCTCDPLNKDEWKLVNIKQTELYQEEILLK